MLLFNVSNCKAENPMFCKKFIVRGDGESTVLRVALDKSPVGMNFIGEKKPASVFMRHSSGRGCEVYLTMKDNILQFEFPVAPEKGEQIDVELEFYYGGEDGQG